MSLGEVQIWQFFTSSYSLILEKYPIWKPPAKNVQNLYNVVVLKNLVFYAQLD